MQINDPTIFARMEAVEGFRWAAVDRRGGEYSLTRLLAAYADYEAHKAEWDLHKFDAETAQLFGHSAVINGEGGWARYVIRGDGELVLERGSTHQDKCRKAEAEGFRILS